MLFKKKSELIKDFNKVYIFIFIFYYLYSIILSFWSQDLYLSLKSSLFYFRFGILVLAINYYLSVTQNFVNKFSTFLVLVIVVVCLDALFQYFFGYNFLGFKTHNSDKLNGLFGDEPILGSYLFRIMPLIFAVLIFRFKQIKYSYLISLLMILMFIVIFLSGSRSSIALSLLFISLFFIFIKRCQKPIIIFATLLLIFCAIFYKINDRFSYTVYYNLVDPVKRVYSNEYTNADLNLKNRSYRLFSAVHESHYLTAYKIFEENKIFGIGNKMFRVACSDKNYYINEFSCTTHPHNYYLQVLSENGLIGFLILIFCFFSCSTIILKEFWLRYFRKIEKVNDPCIIILIGLFVSLWPIIPTGNLFNNWISIMIYFPLGFYYFLKKNYNAN